jgi:DNA repair exonuclease SbcCD ATPase subunit
MDDGVIGLLEKTSSLEADCLRAVRLQERLDGLLREAAEVQVQLSRADGSIEGIPHYSTIEGQAHELGRQLSREVQARQMNELAALQPQTAKCPDCGTRCELHLHRRELNSIDGPLPLQEVAAHCLCCRRDFFPSA